MQKGVIALGLAGLLLASGSSTAYSAVTVPPAKSVITSLNSDLTARPLGQDSLQLNPPLRHWFFGGGYSGR